MRTNAESDVPHRRYHYRPTLDLVHTELLPRTYAEIGVARGGTLALLLPGTAAAAIDPKPRIQRPVPRSAKVFSMTSDEFFAAHDLRQVLGGRPVDVGFIDGMHLFEFALRDFINLERYSGPDSVLLLHDCYPLDAVTASREHGQSMGNWSGDVWKVIACLKQHRPDLDVSVADVRPSGLAIVTGLDSTSTVLADRFDEICREYVPLDYDFLAEGKDAKLNRVAGDPRTVRALLPDRPYRRGSRRLLRVGRDARRLRKRPARKAVKLGRRMLSQLRRRGRKARRFVRRFTRPLVRRLRGAGSVERDAGE
jgi:methyltransferase family protein